MTQGVYIWSRTAGSNGNIDTSINMAEGMSPSAVNDGVRALMARVADFRDDIAGSITTGGVSTAYTVASNAGFDTLAHLSGQMIAFVPHTTCGATVTLNVDSLGAKPLRSSPGVEVGAGVLVQGTPYVALYNNSDGAFYLRGFFANQFIIPVGSFLVHSSSTPPNSNFILPYGQAISRTTYATYFAMVSTTFGTGDGSTTFNAPDLRGRSIFGLDNMGGSAASRITVAGGNFDATVLGATGGAQNHTLTSTEMPSHTHTPTVTDPGHPHTVSPLTEGGAAPGGAGFQTREAGGSMTTSSNTTGLTVGIANTGGGAAHTIMPPSMTLPYILRVI